METKGICISGVVSGRTKRFIGENKTELITYKIQAGNKDYYIKDWKPDGVYYKVGDTINMPITIRIYTKNGQSSLDYSILKESTMFGDKF